jgi:hypothetical protein
MCPADTTAEAWRVFLDVQRRMSPSEKLQRVLDLSALVQSAAEAGLRHSYPEADGREIFLRATRQRLGADLFRKVYGSPLADYE